MYHGYGAVFVQGRWKEGAGCGELLVYNPGDGSTIGAFRKASSSDALEVLESACKAFRTWRNTSEYVRAEILNAIADKIESCIDDGARMISLENGKILAQARNEWLSAAKQFRWYAGEALRLYGRVIPTSACDTTVQLVYAPIGVCLAITPWNFPVSLISRKIAPAIAAGCTSIVCPSHETPGSAMLLFDCIRKAGVPSGIVSLLIGDIKDTYRTLINSTEVRKVSFTGSIGVGKQILQDCAQDIKRVSMELGGNAPVIVFDDTDIETSLALAVARKHVNAGQVCIAPDRFYIHSKIYEEFVDRYVECVNRLTIGYGLCNSAPDMGPVITKQRLSVLENIARHSVNKDGGELRSGGSPIEVPGYSEGYYFSPTVITGLSDNALAIASENFGPISAFSSFDDEEEVLYRANAVPHGLAAYIFTSNYTRIQNSLRMLAAGMIGINTFNISMTAAPFGGVKHSGMGREGGAEGIHEYCDTKYACSTIL